MSGRVMEHAATAEPQFGLGFVAGVIFWGGFNTALEATNTEAFCTSCHEVQDQAFEELKTAIQYANRSGVRGTCPDCQVPHNWTGKFAQDASLKRGLGAGSSAPLTHARSSSTSV